MKRIMFQCIENILCVSSSRFKATHMRKLSVPYFINKKVNSDLPDGKVDSISIEDFRTEMPSTLN